VSVLVAVPVPGLDLLTYAVPDGLERPPIGARVVVPLGSRIVTGIVVDHAEEGGGVAVQRVRWERALEVRVAKVFHFQHDRFGVFAHTAAKARREPRPKVR
jgi:primosomal protein N'